MNERFIDWWMGHIVPVVFTAVIALIGLGIAAILFAKAYSLL